MSKLQLPDVTLVAIETREHTLMRMAIEDCLDKVDFGDVVIITDRPLEFSPLTLSHGVHPLFKTVEDWSDKLGWAKSCWNDVAPMLRTSQTLHIQWDSWVWDVSCWDDAYLEYDYIGAPWWYTDGKNVGNSGFALISTRLKRYLRNNALQFPCVSSAEDDLLCRTYRQPLEERGFKWAPEALAHKFAFECCRPHPTSRHFGFHALFNWPEVLPPDRLRERLKIAMASDYITNPRGVIWGAFVNKYPDLVKELLDEELKNMDMEMVKNLAQGANHGERLSVPGERVS